MKINEDCDHAIGIDHKERLFQYHLHEADAGTLAYDCNKAENCSDYIIFLLLFTERCLEIQLQIQIKVQIQTQIQIQTHIQIQIETQIQIQIRIHIQTQMQIQIQLQWQ